MTLPNGTAITYVIDGQNRRIGKKVNGALVETFLYANDLKRVGWYDGTGSLKAQFVFATQAYVPDAMIKAGAVFRLVFDQVGSIRLVVDAAGTVVERLDYDEFGNVVSDTAAGVQPFGFAGGLRDRDIGFTRLGARDYDPFTGRWTAVDPLRFLADDANLFRYVSSDPLNKIDPSGRAFRWFPWWPRRDPGDGNVICRPVRPGVCYLAPNNDGRWWNSFDCRYFCPDDGSIRRLPDPPLGVCPPFIYIQ